jgi:hypothetical protein
VDNLKNTLKAAGGGLDNVAQVLVCLLDPKDFPCVIAVYGELFDKPYLNHATKGNALSLAACLAEPRYSRRFSVSH